MTLSDTVDAVLPPHLDTLVDFLSSDARPTFLLQLRPSDCVRVVYANPALEQLLQFSSQNEFHSWTTALPDLVNTNDDGIRSTYYAAQEWHCKALRPNGYAVVYAVRQSKTETSQPLDGPSIDLATVETAVVNNYDDEDETQWVIDWTRLPCAAVSTWTQYLRGVAWGQTDAGSMETWPDDLRQVLVMHMACADPRGLYWGKDGLLFFNEAASPIFGERVLAHLGLSVRESWTYEPYQKNKEFLREALKAGKPVKFCGVKYTYNRFGFTQDFYYDISILPICGRSGRLRGMSLEFMEVTAAVIQNLRSELTLILLERVAASQDLIQLRLGVMETFEQTQSYLPYALVYTRSKEWNTGLSSNANTICQTFDLKGTVGVASNEAFATVDMTEDSKNPQLAQAFIRSSGMEQIEVLQLEDGTLPLELAIELPDKRRVTTACILPVSSSDEQGPLAFIVLGCNPRQPLETSDVNLMGFIRDTVSRSASVVATPLPQRETQEIVALNHRMAQELRILTAEKNEATFASLARNAPCGMFIVDSQGAPRFLNEKWLQMTGFTSFEQVKDISRTRPFWADLLSEEDWAKQEKAAAESVFAQNFVQGLAQRNEHRLLHPFDPGQPDAPRRFNRWIESITLPEIDSQGRIQGLLGFMMDISDRKQAEELHLQQQQQIQNQHAQQLRDALANKAAADNFIDTVSHELRNPLSAIIQSADEIVASSELSSTIPSAESSVSIADAGRTIIVCAQHMKTIVDDILTLSKLDSNLLTLSQDQTYPDELATQALKMHEAECRAAQISVRLDVNDSYHMHKVGAVVMDRSRILQVLLNLISNAIKFTKSSTRREITISLAAFSTLSTRQRDSVVFADLGSADGDHKFLDEEDSTAPEHDAQDLYIQYKVTDTGRGISSEEMVRLFRRFSQGSAKTYTQYGGSGLGLFISKKLTELQGGQIGAKSDGLGCGTTFAFYIKAKRVTTESIVAERPTSSAIPLQNDSTTESKTLEMPDPRTKVASKGRRFDILIVEDNAINQKVLSKQLRKLGHTVHVANNGVEALDFLPKTEVYQQNSMTSTLLERTNTILLSIILMDIEMPVMDGLTCTRKIRDLEVAGKILRHVPIIAITANARGEQMDQALRSGVDDVVTKPFRIPSLIAAIEGLLDRYTIG